MYARNTIYTFIQTNPVIPRSVFYVDYPFSDFSKCRLWRTVTTVVSEDGTWSCYNTRLTDCTTNYQGVPDDRPKPRTRHVMLRVKTVVCTPNTELTNNTGTTSKEERRQNSGTNTPHNVLACRSTGANIRWSKWWTTNVNGDTGGNTNERFFLILLYHHENSTTSPLVVEPPLCGTVGERK